MLPLRSRPTAASGPHPLTRLAWIIAGAIAALLGIDFLLAVFEKYRHLDPATYTMFWNRRGWLWTHLAGGTLTVLLGPLQFLTQWPRAHPRLHRWSGRLYFSGMLIACTGATGLIATSPAPFGIRLAFASTALAWLVTAGIGLHAILRGDIALHRRWMQRNYLVTLAPISFRLLVKLPGVMALASPPLVIASLLWLSWSLPLVLHVIACRTATLFRNVAAPDEPRLQPVVTPPPQM